MEEKKRAGVQTKMDPCFDKMSLYKVASVCKFGTNLNGVCVSNRCRWPGAHVVRYFFTIHSYLLLLLASPGADGGGAQCAHWAEGASTSFRQNSPPPDGAAPAGGAK